MARRVLVEEYHLSVFIPRDLPEPEAEAARRTLNDPAFEARLRRVVRRIFRKEASLAQARVRLSH
jgi:hypothetical protein